MMDLADCVPALHAFHMHELRGWAEMHPILPGWKGRTCRDIWDASPRGAWLLDYAASAGADRRDLVRAAAACVRPALRFVPEGEDRPRLAVEAAERWADEPTEENRGKARQAAHAVLAVAGMMKAAWAAGAASMTAAEASWARAAPAWAAAAHRHAEGPESEAAAHRACADEVRRLVPFLDLASGGVR